MKTRNVPIKNISGADAFSVEVYNFNGACRCLYKRIEESSDSAKKTDDFSNESRRQINNIWHKNKFIEKIGMKCRETGIEPVTVNPVYTSFIGNIQHRSVDSTNASVEIGRRGLMKYEKDSFCPGMTERDADALGAVLAAGNGGSSTGGDALRKIDCRSFIDAYKSGRRLFSRRDFEHRYRIRIGQIPQEYY